jgi:peptide/nickel transport system substrate-binding protein
MRIARAGFAFVVAVLLAGTVAGAGSARYGGTLVVGLSRGDVDALDPTVSRTFSAVAIYPAICLQLFQSVRNHGTIEMQPVLAASLPQISPDKLSYTIRLRKGILFNDGTPFNAQAVVFTVQRFMTFPGSSRASNFTDVAGVTAEGAYTVVFHLKAKDSTFYTNNMYVLSPTAVAKEGDGFGADPVCVGPFMFDHRVPGDNITVIKSPWFFDRGDVHLDKIVFKPETDAAAAVAALQAGDIQVLDNVSPVLLPAVQQNASLRVLSAPNVGWAGVQINIGNRNGIGNLPYANVGTPLASSPDLRQAFEEAIDRQALNKVVFGGLYQPSCTPVAPASSWFAATKIPCTPYDPADARKLVARSGFSNPTVRLLTPNTSDALRLAQFLQSEERAVGINVVIESTDPAGAQARAATGNFDAYLASFFTGSDDPNGNITMFLSTGGVRNNGGYSSTRLDYVLANALKATQMDPRAVDYRAALQIIRNDRPIIYLYNQLTIAGYSSSITGLQLSGGGALIPDYAQYR